MVARGAEDPAEMLLMVRLLSEIGYRELSQDSGRQRLSVARRLSRDGIDHRVLKLLWHYAQESDTQRTPERLFSYWLDLPSRTHAKVGEMRARSVWIKRKLDAMESEEKAGAEAPIHDINTRRSAQ